MQRNNFLQLIKVIIQWKFHLNLCYKVILFYKTLIVDTKLILINITIKENNFFLFRCTTTSQTLDSSSLHFKDVLECSARILEIICISKNKFGKSVNVGNIVYILCKTPP